MILEQLVSFCCASKSRELNFGSLVFFDLFVFNIILCFQLQLSLLKKA